MKKISVSDNVYFDNHENIYELSPTDDGVAGFIAIHNTHLGPAIGGTRYWAYPNKEAALNDALRLSRAMSYKCAVSGIPFGGGKAVVIAKKEEEKERQIRSLAKQVNLLKGSFYTGEDVGVQKEDVVIMAKESEYIVGRPGFAEDPSPYAAKGVKNAILEVVKHTKSLREQKGISVYIKGAGKVGATLAQLLQDSKISIYICDIEAGKVEELKHRLPSVMGLSECDVDTVDADIVAPCAMGNDITFKNVHKIKTKVICGAANNQLQNEELAEILHQRSVIYVPDFVANAGGLISVADELEKGGFNKDRVLARIDEIGRRVVEILNASLTRNKSPLKIANEMARKHLK